MVEVVVHDMMVRTPKGRDVKWLAAPQEEGPERTRVVLLKEKAGKRVLPIWVGIAEGDALAMQLAEMEWRSFRSLPQGTLVNNPRPPER